MIATRLVVAAVGIMCATAAAAQTHSELLEKGIFTEETSGDLDGALRIYEGLVNAPAIPAEIAARARARLSHGRLQRERASRAAANAARSARVPVGGSDRIGGAPSAMASASAKPAAQTTTGCCGMFSGNYDPARAVAVSGVVTAVMWVNPQSFVLVQGDDGAVWGFTMASPNMQLLGGMTRNSIKPGERVLIYGYLARGSGKACPTQLPNACVTFENGALHASASTITAADGKTIFDRVTMEDEAERRRQEQQLRPSDAGGR
jgi:hypothetical protein